MQGANLALTHDERSPFRHFKTGPEIIRLAGMLYVRFPHFNAKFVSVHALGFDHFTQDRSYCKKPHFNMNRNAALVAWRGLCAALWAVVLA